MSIQSEDEAIEEILDTLDVAKIRKVMLCLDLPIPTPGVGPDSQP